MFQAGSFDFQEILQPAWRAQLADYVTAMAWRPDGSSLVACSACGEVVLYCAETGKATVLQDQQSHSLDVLAISSDGRFLAVAGQLGTVSIWELDDPSDSPLATCEFPRTWIDCLQWNPRYLELAIALGRYVQVWDLAQQAVTTTLPFADSSVLALAWHPQGQHLSASGNQRIKTWQRHDWDGDPEVLETAGASLAIAWSADGGYLASGHNDCSLLVWEQGNPYPWQMQGFPGKVRQLVWPSAGTHLAAPLLAASSAESIVAWQRDTDPMVGWRAQVLAGHSEPVNAIAFQPRSTLLASAAADGWVCLWENASQVAQILQSAPIACLAWNPQGTKLAGGGERGEILVWQLT